MNSFWEGERSFLDQVLYLYKSNLKAAKYSVSCVSMCKDVKHKMNLKKVSMTELMRGPLDIILSLRASPLLAGLRCQNLKPS